ncbi:sensor histidine kinase [Gordonia sp. TBRC 11910]|uniref:Sensor histidine kinase n=1 Tax=Gordonia asplenii TaxID=2725283 RepID=A0A848KXH5_9ACTN|nr:sensor histidine kinase [Gordonia asplenii]NMO00901.1 sensor histidine kinase [Gordonia asplenii]
MHDSPLTPVFATLRLCLHALVLALAAVVVVRAAAESGPHRTAVIVVTLAWLACYALGAGLRRRPSWTLTWLGVLSAGWLALVVLTPDAGYLAFALFFLYLHLLPRRAGLVAVTAATVASIAGFLAHSGFTAAAVIGPTLGAAVAVTIASGYARLYAEVIDRERLIAELREARAELAAQQHAAGILAERERLAGEIHDTVAQSLSSIGMLIHAAARTVDAPELALAGQATADALGETRALIDGLAPASLRERSLVAALQRITASNAGHGVEVRLRVDGEPRRVSMPIEAALVRITQSLLANVVQHSRAASAHVTLTYSADSIHLDVADDGAGFDVGAVLDTQTSHRPGSLGLRLVGQRVTDLGGDFSVESDDGGSVVAVSFPLDDGAGQDSR